MFTGSWNSFAPEVQGNSETGHVPTTQLFPFALLLPVHRFKLSYAKYVKTRCQLHRDGIRMKMLSCYEQNSADLRLRSFTTCSSIFFPQLGLHHVRSFRDYYDQFIEVHCQEAVCALNAQSSPASCAENPEP